jgi:hypothetical protein
VAGLSSLLLSPAPMGIQSIACVVVVAEAVMYQGRGGLPAIVRRLVDGYSLATALGRLFPSCGGWWADASPSWCSDDARWRALRHRDAELSAYYTAACSSSV